jgi:hypothetical protein
MVLRREGVIAKLAVVIGLALALTFLLLHWAFTRSSPVHAGAQPVQDGAGERSLPAQGGDVGVAWTSTEPVTTLVIGGEPQEWVISQYGVTVTFYENSIAGQAAIFTFTPKTGVPSNFPVAPTPYFFDLSGEWAYPSDGEVSLYHEIGIALAYKEADLGGIEESGLQVFNYRFKEWMNTGATVNVTENLISWETNYTGLFAVGGYRFRTFLPAVFRTSTLSSARAP